MSSVSMEPERARVREDILPIDRGWAWVTVAVGGMVFALSGGGYKCQGMILVELKERLPRIPTSDLLWVFTITSMTFILGPAISYVITRLTHRIVLIGGLLLMTSGYVALAYASTLPALILLCGIPIGIANPIAYMTSMLGSGQYFNKRKALAYGLVASGSGLGTIILPVILRNLFDNFSFPEAMVYYAGFVLQFVWLACLMRPISYYEMIHRKELRLLSQNPEVGSRDKTNSSHARFLSRRKSANDAHELQFELDQSVDSSISPKARIKAVRRFSTTEIVTSSSKQCINDILNDKSDENDGEKRKRREIFKLPAIKKTEAETSVKKSISSSPMSSSSDSFGENARNENNEKTTPGVHMEQGSSKKERFNIRIAYNPKMVMFAVSNLAYCMGIMIVYQCLPPLAKESGVSKGTVALVFTVMGSLEIPSRVLNGYLADRHIVTGYTQYIATLITAGLSVLAGGLLSGLAGLIVALLGLSVCGTSVFNLVPVVLSELLGAENLTTAMGVQLGSQGIATLMTTIITGHLYNITSSWRLVFLYISGCMISGGAILLPYWIYTKCTNCTSSREETSTQSASSC